MAELPRKVRAVWGAMLRMAGLSSDEREHGAYNEPNEVGRVIAHTTGLAAGGSVPLACDSAGRLRIINEGGPSSIAVEPGSSPLTARIGPGSEPIVAIDLGATEPSGTYYEESCGEYVIRNLGSAAPRRLHITTDCSPGVLAFGGESPGGMELPLGLVSDSAPLWAYMDKRYLRVDVPYGKHVVIRWWDVG